MRDRWLNPRRKRFWAIVGVILYTVLGFLLVPALVERAVTRMVQQDLGREVRIGQTQFNPYLFKLRVAAFELTDKDGARLISFDEFLVDFELSSLFQWAWVFREISLSSPYFFFERFETDDSRLSRLLADAAADDTIETGEEDGGALPRMLIQAIRIDDGSADLTDNIPPTPVSTRLGPITAEINELNTLPDRYGQQSVTITMERGATLGWQGSLSLAPLESEGELVLSGSRLDQTIAYLRAVLPLESMSATLSARLSYRIHMESDGELDIDIDGLQAELSDVAVTGLEPAAEFLRLGKASLFGGTLRYPEQTLQFSSLKIEQPELVAWRDESGGLSLEQLSGQPGGETKTGGADSTGAWVLGIDEVTVEGGAADLSDRSVTPAVTVGVQDLQFRIADVSNAPGGRFPVNLSANLSGGGQFSVEGNLSVLPDLELSAEVRTDGIPLGLGQPYLAQMAQVSVTEGALDSNLELTLNKDGQANLGGSVELPGLKITDTRDDRPLVGWDQMEIDRFDFDLAATSLRLSRVRFEQPYARLVINADGTTNLTGLAVTGQAADEDSGQSAKPFDLTVGGIGIEEGNLDFSDLSLPLPFATRIAGLDGIISTISTLSAEPSNIRLEGQVDEFGLARIEGSMNLLDPVKHTDVSLEFRNLLMSDLSPYTIQFAGQEIAEGKLDLDLGYFIDEGRLQGQNDIVLSDLVLGEKVDHPDAASLPLGLAVALLKDADGVIDIDLPVEGDINDPEFKIGGVVWQAIAGLITKIVSAPFSLLGSLIGIDSEDLGQFQFLAGRSDLTPPELEKIGQLEEALGKRPELTVEISGATDPAIDVPALQYLRLFQTVRDRLGEDDSGDDDETLMLDDEVRQLLGTLFSERFPDIPLASLESEYMAPPANDPEGEPVLDELALSAGLRDRLLESETISPQDLEALASARAQSIRDAFLAGGSIDESRIVIADSQEVESEDGEWVVMELGVAAE